MLAAALVLLSPPQIAKAQSHLNGNGPRSSVIQGKSHGHSFKVVMEKAAFRKHGRRLGAFYEPTYKVYFPAVDGRRLYGWDAWTKKEILTKINPQLETRNDEIIRFDVSIDGRHIQVAKRWYDDLLDPNLEKGGVKVVLSKNGQDLMISMGGSDGGGGYGVRWNISRQGKIARKIDLSD